MYPSITPFLDVVCLDCLTKLTLAHFGGAAVMVSLSHSVLMSGQNFGKEIGLLVGHLHGYKGLQKLDTHQSVSV